MGWRKRYKVHPAADVYPMLSDDELKALGEPYGAQDEFLLAATAQNLRKLAKLRSEPPPAMQLA